MPGPYGAADFLSHRLQLPAQAAEKSLLPGFAVQGIGLITENGVLGLGRSAVVFAPRSFGSTAYEALYGNDFM